MIRGYVLGEQWFATKEEVKRKVREILHGYPLGACTNMEDTDILLDLLQRHPRASHKIGCGIAAFEIRRSPLIATERCFYLVRVDGSEDDFSYIKCITAPTAPMVFRSICRRLVGFDVAIFKDRYFQEYARADGSIQCPITGEWVGYEQAHVDHIPPDTFEHLVRTFIEMHHIDVTQVQLRHIDTVVGPLFADDQLTKQWVKFHQEQARLRVVSAYANLHIIPRQVREGKLMSGTGKQELWQVTTSQEREATA